MAEDIEQTAKEIAIALIPLCCKTDMDEQTMDGFINRAIYVYKTTIKKLKLKPKAETGVSTFKY